MIEKLKLAAQTFLDDPAGCQVEVSKNTVHLSQIFKWYKEDFGGSVDKVSVDRVSG